MKQPFYCLFLTLSLIIVASCDGLFPIYVTVDFDYNKFQEQKSLWNSSKPADYQYRLESDNNGYSIPVNTLIIVENNTFKNQIPYVNDYGYECKSYIDLTITEVYERIEEEYKRYNNTNQKYDYLKKITIIYDTENHIPIEIKKYYHIPANVADASSYVERKISEYKVNN